MGLFEDLYDINGDGKVSYGEAWIWHEEEMKRIERSRKNGSSSADGEPLLGGFLKDFFPAKESLDEDSDADIQPVKEEERIPPVGAKIVFEALKKHEIKAAAKVCTTVSFIALLLAVIMFYNALGEDPEIAFVLAVGGIICLILCLCGVGYYVNTARKKIRKHKEYCLLWAGIDSFDGVDIK